MFNANNSDSLTSNNAELACNVLVYDSDPNAIKLIESVVHQCNVIKPESETGNILTLLQHDNFQETDICAVFLSENSDINDLTGFEIAKVIHRHRNNIPVFVRLSADRELSDLSSDKRNLIAGCYNTNDPDSLKKYTDKFLYGFYFPNSLVDIFLNAGLEVLKNTFRSCEIKSSKPFLLYDHIITTEYTSILPVQFNFGNGVLTFLMKEDDAIRLVANEHTALKKSQTNCDYMNQLVSEVMNLYWGKVRKRCEDVFGDEGEKKIINIPLVVNHKKNYISYGNHVPQLCFRYILLRDVSIPEPFVVEFKFMFSSILRPNDFPKSFDTKRGLKEDDGFEMF